jgi:hypothetical protein
MLVVAKLWIRSAGITGAALFADMLSLPNDGRYPALEPNPQQRRQRTLEALTAQLAGLFFPQQRARLPARA